MRKNGYSLRGIFNFHHPDFKNAKYTCLYYQSSTKATSIVCFNKEIKKLTDRPNIYLDTQISSTLRGAELKSKFTEEIAKSKIIKMGYVIS